MYDQSLKLEIERFGGIKLLRKYRKANRLNDFIKPNQNIKLITVFQVKLFLQSLIVQHL